MLRPQTALIRSFDVVPHLPEPLRGLWDIAYNLWWSWHPEAIELFVRLDRNIWQETGHNPVKMLGQIPQKTLDAFAKDEGFLSSLARVQANLDQHMERSGWLEQSGNAPDRDMLIAYFCAEFGLTECLPIYSGGLGCLAGDHLKSAAELGLPFIAVGLLYRNGYFQQYLNADGWQQESQPNLDFSTLPIRPVLNADGKQVKVRVALPDREVTIGVWKVIVGCIDLYLLDTNLPENDERDRHITDQLYGGDQEHRIKQEIILGIGGMRALDAIGIQPDVYHMNEGHSAFLALERIRKLIEKYDISFDEAREFAAAGNVFTTHTPVPAGIDHFPKELVSRYFEHYWKSLRLNEEGLLALGRENVFNQHEEFSMAILALRTSTWSNGVSKMHGKVSRNMWQNIWPGVPEKEVPITHVTNGVHARSWLSGDLQFLLDRYLGGRWQSRPADHEVWKSIHEVPDEELWGVHQRRRQRLIVHARRMLREQLSASGTSHDRITEMCDALSPTAFTIGFARRFATYKRGTLFMRDRDRLMRLLKSTDRPMQILIAGKSHPADGGGKDLIRQIVHFSRETDSSCRVVFLENYDIRLARLLVQGADLWLNTPRRGMEASGTSGMKAAINGVLNCSILDGWWDEACEPEVGWAIGRREIYQNPDVADEMESQSLYDLLEREIVPMFYDRDAQGLPRKWIRLMKNSIAQLAPKFNTNRMVQEYTENLYLPAFDRANNLGEGDLKASMELAASKAELREQWHEVRVSDVKVQAKQPLGVSDQIQVQATVRLGSIPLEHVRVQAYVGQVDPDGTLNGGQVVDLEKIDTLGKGEYRMACQIAANTSGKHGLALRVVPGGPYFNIPVPGLIYWEQPPSAKKPSKMAAAETRG